MATVYHPSPINASFPTVPTTVIRAGKFTFQESFSDILLHRHTFLLLIKRDLQIRYSQTILGIAWVVLQPLSITLAFWLVYGQMTRITYTEIPYPLFVFTGLVPWMFFTNAITNGSNSLLAYSSIIGKVYFPRLLIPLAVVSAGLVDFIIGIVIQVGIAFYYGGHLDPMRIPFFILNVVLLLMLSVGLSLNLAILTFKYRDLRYVLPLLLQFGLFVTPISYPIGILSSRIGWLAELNPMLGIIEGYKAFWFNQVIPWYSLGISTLFAGVILVLGFFLFQQRESELADIL